MKLTLCILMCLWGNCLVMAQNQPEAEKFLKNISAKYKGYKDFKVNYNFILENLADSMREEQSGTLYLKGDMFKLDMNGTEIINDSKTSWAYMKDANEVTINSVDPDDDGMNPKDIFTFHEKGLTCRFKEETTENGKKIQIVDLTPIDGEKPYFRIRLWISKKDQLLVRTKIFEKMGNRYTYELKDFAHDLSLDKNFFFFDPSKYPDIEVVDLR